MDIGVLGPVTVDGEDALSPRDRVVLAALTVDPGVAVTSEALASALWPDDPPASWSKVVQGCVMRLRRVLGQEAIETTSQGYRLRVPAQEVDASRFLNLLARGQELIAVGDPERAVVTLREALSLWRGPVYVDLLDWDAGRIAAGRLAELRHVCEEELLEASIRAGRHSEVLAEAQARAAEEPLRERRWGLLARAEYQSGRRAEAIRTIQRARTFVASETGLSLGPDLISLEDAMLAEDPSLTVESLAPEPTTFCPYPGLIHYGVRDSESFFGREAAIAEALAILADQGVVVVVGPSGSGKSSLVRAGIAATLAREGDDVRIITPGHRPTDALDGVPHSTTLVVDQAEEVITACDDPKERTAFLRELGERTKAQPVVIALRADRIGDMTQDPTFARIVQRGLLLLGPLGGDDLRAAIGGPARRAGLLIEPGLMELLVREVENEPGALPLLSHALRRTWELRDGRVLTTSGYRRSGGIRGAVSQSAEAVHAGLSPEQQQRLRDLMLRLVTPDAEGDPIPAAIPRRWITDDESRRRLVELLIDERLVTSTGATVQIAHEALTRAWPRFRTWLDDDVEGQRILRHLALAADSWDSMERPDSELYRGLRLQNALDWCARRRPDLTDTERAFLERSEALAESQAADVVRRAEEQARANRRLRLLLTGTAIFLAIALVAGFVAVRSADRADAEAQAAQAARAQALASAAIGEVGDDRSRGLLLAVEAARLATSPLTTRALLEGLVGGLDPNRTTIETGATDYMAAAVTGDGLTAVAKTGDGSLDVIDLTTRQPRHTGLPGAASPVGGLGVHPTAPLAAVSGFSGEVAAIVYDLATGEEVARLGAENEGLHFAEFSPDGSLAVTDGLGTVRIFDSDTWTETNRMSTSNERLVSALGFADEGRSLVVADVDSAEIEPGRLTVFDPSTGTAIVGPVETDQILITDIVEIPGRHEIAVAGEYLRWLSLGDLAPVADAVGPLEGAGLVALAAWDDGTLVAGSPVDLQIVHADEERHRVDPVPLGAPGVAVVGGALTTADIDGTISTWQLVPNVELGTPLQPEGSGLVTMSPDASTLAVWGTGRGVQIFERSTLQHTAAIDLGPDQSILGLSFASDGATLATVDCPFDADPCNAALNTWNTRDGSRIAGPADAGPMWPFIDSGVVYVGDELLATASQTGSVRLWDAGSLQPIDSDLVLAEHTPTPGSDVWGMAAGTVDDTTFLAAFDQLGQSVVWRFDGGEPELVGAIANALRNGFTPDGRLITSSGRGEIVFRDPNTLEPDDRRVLSGDNPATAYGFDASGDVMVTSGGFGTVLWHVPSGVQMSGSMPALRSELAPDGRLLYLGGHPAYGSAVMALSLEPDDLIVQACRMAGRNLTGEEWRTLMGDEPRRVTCPEWPVLG